MQPRIALYKNMLIGLTQQSDKFRFVGQMPSHQSTGHCEPVTDVTGVAISNFSGISRIFGKKMFENPGDCHASVRYFFAMTTFFNSSLNRNLHTC